MVIITTIWGTIIVWLEPRTFTKVTDRPMYESVKLSMKELAQINDSIKTTHAAFPEGAKYRFTAEIMIASKYHKQVTTLGDTCKFTAP